MFIAPGLQLHEAAITLRFVRASGPGGQNVNKVATAVELRFDLGRAGIADEGFLLRLVELAGRRLTSEGVIVLQADGFRTQEQNRAEARDRLLDLLKRAATPPKRRVATKVPRGSKLKRLGDKRHQAARKADRRAKD